MKKTLVATTAIILTASLTAASAHGRGGPKFDFSTIDADGNGEITQAEITAFETAQFAETDTNGDGLLSQEELVAQVDTNNADRAARRIERMISNLDTNEDGAISLEERQSNDRSARMFDRLDSDDSGTISEEEAQKAADRGGRGKGKGKGKDRKGNKRG